MTAPTLPPAGPARIRHDRLDALRGAAVVWMAVFHFSYDLNHFGLWHPYQWFLQDPFWTTQRSAIVTLFLLCAGMGQAVALRAEAGRERALFDRRFWRRWLQVAGCAALVSVASAWMFPRSWIFFGVLHGIAVMLLLCRLAAPLPGWLLVPLSLLALVLPAWLQHPVFDTAPLRWVGLNTHKPVTEDWVPVLPWVGVVWAGYAVGRWLMQWHPAAVGGRLPRALQPLALLGRWSLSFYMLHQPLLIGALMAGRAAGAW